MTVIVRGAGGQITQLNNDAVDYKTSTALATNGFLHNQVVDRFNNTR